MLARANRIVRADDYRNTVRRGRKSAAAHCVVYVRQSADPATDRRFGFIVSKAVGNAVTRNTVRRRLKAVSHEILTASPPSRFLPQRTDVVIRALPGSPEVPWSTLLEEVSAAIAKVSPVDNKGVTA